jgi:hypothetical protein
VPLPLIVIAAMLAVAAPVAEATVPVPVSVAAPSAYVGAADVIVIAAVNGQALFPGVAARVVVAPAPTLSIVARCANVLLTQPEVFDTTVGPDGAVHVAALPLAYSVT